jgi:hypothetical protein
MMLRSHRDLTIGDIDRAITGFWIARDPHKLFPNFRADNRQRQAVFAGVVIENASKACSDDTPDAQLHQTPNRMLAAGTTSKVVTNDQDGRFCPRRLI